MSFFVTSVGVGRGGNLGGLAGADAHCQSLAAAVGRGNVTWRAYLSTQGPNAVNARDRIGNGPWYNQRGQVIARSVAELHGDTLEQARIGNFISLANSLDEKGQPVPSGFPGNEHDLLTGSTLDGRAYTDNTRDFTCSNWTSAADGSVPDGVVPRSASAWCPVGSSRALRQGQYRSVVELVPPEPRLQSGVAGRDGWRRPVLLFPPRTDGHEGITMRQLAHLIVCVVGVGAATARGDAYVED